MIETDDESERHEKILKGNYAIIGTVISNVFFPVLPVSSADLKVKKIPITAVLTSDSNDELIVIRMNLFTVLRSNLRTDWRSDLEKNWRSNLFFGLNS